MWRTTVFYNMDTIQGDGLDINLAEFNRQRNELHALDGKGNTVAGFEMPNLANPPDDHFTIKRDWNSEQHARAFADLVASTFGEYATATVEEQV